jgi:Na+-driven multidrug efflux pump
MFVNLGSQGLGQASGIIVGQNLGAGNTQRARQTVLWAGGYVLMIKGTVSLLVFLFPQIVLRIFTRDPELLALASAWVRIQAVSYVALGASQVATQSFQTAGDTLIPALVLLLSTWLVQQPLAHYLPYHFGLGELGVAWAITISVLVRPIVFIPYFIWGPWMYKHPLGRVELPGGGTPASTPPAQLEGAAVAQPVVASAEPTVSTQLNS